MHERIQDLFFLSLLCSLSILFAREDPPLNPPKPLLVRSGDEDYIYSEKPSDQNLLKAQPWLTGPLLTPSAYIVPPKYYNIQPYLFFNNSVGVYDTSWNNQSLPTSPGNLAFSLFFETGILPFMDFTIFPQVFYNFNNGASCWRFGDLNALISFQLLNNVPGTWIPAIRFVIGETFPTGEYQNLDPSKYGTDIGGWGTFETSFALVLSQLWHLGGDHYLADRLAIELEVPMPVNISGYSVYGGNAATNGIVYPGISQNTYIGLEYTFTKNWALALDIASLFYASSPFEGTTGGAVVGFDSYSYTLSLAPAIEYNLSHSIGFIGGVWFSVLGRNALSFVNGVIAVNFYFP